MFRKKHQSFKVIVRKKTHIINRNVNIILFLRSLLDLPTQNKVPSLKEVKSLASNLTNIKLKIADSVLLSLFMKDNEKCSISHVPMHWSILSTKYIKVIDPEGPETV